LFAFLFHASFFGLKAQVDKVGYLAKGNAIMGTNALKMNFKELTPRLKEVFVLVAGMMIGVRMKLLMILKIPE
jgi:hypothetical protein